MRSTGPFLSCGILSTHHAWLHYFLLAPNACKLRKRLHCWPGWSCSSHWLWSLSLIDGICNAPRFVLPQQRIHTEAYWWRKQRSAKYWQVLDLCARSHNHALCFLFRIPPNLVNIQFRILTTIHFILLKLSILSCPLPRCGNHLPQCCREIAGELGLVLKIMGAKQGQHHMQNIEVHGHALKMTLNMQLRSGLVPFVDLSQHSLRHRLVCVLVFDTQIHFFKRSRLEQNLFHLLASETRLRNQDLAWSLHVTPSNTWGNETR